MEPPATEPCPELGTLLLALALAEPPPPPLSARCSPADAGAPCGFATLPDGVVSRVFAALPADARARCASVCRAWAHALMRGADAWRCWTRLDLSGGSGVTCTKSDAALAGAAALARGRLQELDLSGRGHFGNRDLITLGAVLRVLRGSPELRTLALDGVAGNPSLLSDELQQLLAAAPPSLQRLDAFHVICDSAADSLPLLRAAQPSGPLRMRDPFIDCSSDLPDEDIGAAVGALRFGATVAHAWVRELILVSITWAEPAALEALADALLARTCRVERLVLSNCSELSPVYLPALARLLAGRDGAALAKMVVNYGPSLFVGASEAELELVCAALRRTTLTDVGLHNVGLTEQSAATLRVAAATASRLSLTC